MKKILLSVFIGLSLVGCALVEDMYNGEYFFVENVDSSTRIDHKIVISYGVCTYTTSTVKDDLLIDTNINLLFSAGGYYFSNDNLSIVVSGNHKSPTVQINEEIYVFN